MILEKPRPWYIWMFLSLFGGGMILGLYMLLDRRPKLILDGFGLRDKRLRGLSLPWEAIGEVYLATLASQRFLSLALEESHPDVYCPPARDVKLNSFFGLEPFNINISDLRVDPDRLCATVAIMSRIPPEERETLLMMLADTKGLLSGKRPDPRRA